MCIIIYLLFSQRATNHFARPLVCLYFRSFSVPSPPRHARRRLVRTRARARCELRSPTTGVDAKTTLFHPVTNGLGARGTLPYYRRQPPGRFASTSPTRETGRAVKSDGDCRHRSPADNVVFRRPNGVRFFFSFFTWAARTTMCSVRLAICRSRCLGARNAIVILNRTRRKERAILGKSSFGG